MRWWILAELCAVGLLYAVVAYRRSRGLRAPLCLGAMLAALAVVSVAWSAAPRVSLERAVGFTVLLVTAAALGVGAAGRERRVGHLLLALAVGAVGVAVAGLVHYAFSPEQAVIAATTAQGPRYNGLGANPNSMSMLLAISLPIGAWALWEAGSRLAKTVGVAALLLVVGSISTSGSRGAIAGAVLGMLVFAAAAGGERRARLALAAVVGLVTVAGLAALELQRPAERNTRVQLEEQTITVPEGAELFRPLDSDIGWPGGGRAHPQRTLIGASTGRVRALEGGLGLAADRPVLGHGFGTEDHVFVDRYYLFFSSRVENSYIAIALEIGVVGLALLLGLVGLVLVRAARSLGRLEPRRRRAAAACMGAVTAGLVLGATQSYWTAPGSVAAPTFWLALSLLAAVVARSRGAADEPAAQFEDGERGEGEQDAAERHREPSLDVVRREHGGVRQ